MRITLVFSFLLATSIAWSQAIIPFANWGPKISKLLFTTAAQTPFAGNCSGIVTLRTYTPSNTAQNQAFDLTVNLTATSGFLSFYSDASCTRAVTSVVIAAGTSTVDFYYILDSIATETITATATGYPVVTQNTTTSTNPFVWTGASTSPANANWNNGGNWSGGVAPGSSNKVLFNGSCSSNCSPNLTANVGISGARLAPGYGGTITQGSYTFTSGSGGYGQLAGTFVGSSTAAAITFSGAFAVSGGTFTSTTGALTASTSSYSFIISSPGIFNANGGTVALTTYKTVDVHTGVLFNDVDVSSTGNGPSMTVVNPLNVEGNLTLGYTQTNGSYTGIFNVKKNVTYVGNAWRQNNSGPAFTVRMVGSGTQNITGNVASYYLSALEFAQSGNVVINTTGTPTFSHQLKYTSGTVTFTNTSIGLRGNAGTTGKLDLGSLHTPNLSLSLLNGGTLDVVGTLFVDGNLNLEAGGCSSCGGLTGGDVELLKDLNYTGWFGSITSTIKFKGSTLQTITNAAANINAVRFELDNSAGARLGSGSTAFQAIHYLTLTNGNFDMNGVNLNVYRPINTGSLQLNGNTLTKSAGVLTVNSVTVGTGSLYGGTVNP